MAIVDEPCDRFSKYYRHMKLIKLLYVVIPIYIGVQFAFTNATKQRMRKKARLIYSELFK